MDLKMNKSYVDPWFSPIDLQKKIDRPPIKKVFCGNVLLNDMQDNHTHKFEKLYRYVCGVHTKTLHGNFCEINYRNATQTRFDAIWLMF